MSFTKEETNKVKGIAILLLVFHHCFYRIDIFETFNIRSFLSADSISDMATLARVCVWIFVFLSSYGLTCQYMNRSSLEKIDVFLFKRWFSLMVFYWPVYLLRAIFMICTHQNLFEKYDRKILYIVLDAMGWGDFFSTPMIGGVHWYMCLAQIIIFLIPLLVLSGKKIGWGMLPLAICVLPILSQVQVSPYGGNYANYFVVIVLGVLFAQYQIFEKIRKMSGVRGILELVCLLSGIIIVLYCRLQLTNVEAFDTRSLPSFMSTVAAVLIIVVAFLYLRGPVGKLLQFLGKHSGNMFLIHTLFIGVPFAQYIMQMKYVLFIWVCVSAIALLCSMLLEFIKKISRYNVVMKIISTNIQKMLQIKC